MLGLIVPDELLQVAESLLVGGLQAVLDPALQLLVPL